MELKYEVGTVLVCMCVCVCTCVCVCVCVLACVRVYASDSIVVTESTCRFIVISVCVFRSHHVQVCFHQNLTHHVPSSKWEFACMSLAGHLIPLRSRRALTVLL